MDSKRYYTEANLQNFYVMLSYKLSQMPTYNAVIVADDNALLFALEHQQEMFAHTPIVFLGVNQLDLAMAQNDNPLVTGIVEAVSMRETVALMQRLSPNLSTIYVIVDDTSSGQGDLHTLRDLTSEFPGVRFTELDLSSLTFAQLGQRLQTIKPSDAALLLSAYHDAGGETVDFDEGLQIIRTQLNAPLYHLWYHGMGDGVLGGKIISQYEQGQQAAKIVQRILNGEPIARIPVLVDSPNKYMFDYVELQRYGIPLNRLPADSTIINQPQTFFTRYKYALLPLALVFAVLLLFIIVLLGNIAKRRQVEQQLRAGEQRYKRRNRELHLLNRVIVATATHQDTPSLLETVCRELAFAFDIPQVVALRILPNEPSLEIVTDFQSGDTASVAGQKIPVDKNPMHQLLVANPKPVIIDNADTDPRLADFADVQAIINRRQVKSIMLLPLVVEGQAWGVLSLGANQANYFTQADLALAHSVASQVSGSLAQVHLVEEHRRLEARYHQAQKMEALGRLTGGVAHDFNNILTIINGFAELIQLRIPAHSPVQPMLNNIISSGQRAAKLIEQLLTFSRKQFVEPQILSLNDVVDDMQKMFVRVIPETVSLLINLDSGRPHIKIDPSQLEQVILNLVVNARDAMPNGGQISISTGTAVLTRPQTSLELNPGTYATLTVSDTGIGIPDSVKIHIFEPFFTTKAVGQGTGLGLATVYGIVKQNNGDVSVHSQPGHGATFTIFFPLDTQHSNEISASSGPANNYNGHETILLVEDNDDVRNMARMSLQTYGYQILEAANGEAAIQLASSFTNPIHLLLTDVVMPGLTGPQLADALYRRRPQLRVLYMSGYTDNNIDLNNPNIPHAEFIQKPVLPSALAQKVRTILG